MDEEKANRDAAAFELLTQAKLAADAARRQAVKQDILDTLKSQQQVREVGVAVGR